MKTIKRVAAMLLTVLVGISMAAGDVKADPAPEFPVGDVGTIICLTGGIENGPCWDFTADETTEYLLYTKGYDFEIEVYEAPYTPEFSLPLESWESGVYSGKKLSVTQGKKYRIIFRNNDPNSPEALNYASRYFLLKESQFASREKYLYLGGAAEAEQFTLAYNETAEYTFIPEVTTKYALSSWGDFETTIYDPDGNIVPVESWKDGALRYYKACTLTAGLKYKIVFKHTNSSFGEMTDHIGLTFSGKPGKFEIDAHPGSWAYENTTFYMMYINFYPEGTKTDITWSSSDESVAMVNPETGRLETYNPGTATIRATGMLAEDLGEHTAEWQIIVKERPDLTIGEKVVFDIEKYADYPESDSGPEYDIIPQQTDIYRVSIEVADGYENTFWDIYDLRNPGLGKAWAIAAEESPAVTWISLKEGTGYGLSMAIRPEWNDKAGSGTFLLEAPPVLTAGQTNKLDGFPYFNFTPEMSGDYNIQFTPKTSGKVYFSEVGADNSKAFEVAADKETNIVVKAEAGKRYQLSVEQNYAVEYSDFLVNVDESSVADFADVLFEVQHIHNLVKTEAKAPTYTTAGNTEYYTCNICNKLFSDATAEKIISNVDDVVLPQLVEVEKNEAAVSNEAIEEAMQSASNGDVHLSLSGLSEKIESVSLPMESVEAIAEKAGSLTISMTEARVSLDQKTIAAILKQAAGDTVSVKVQKIPEQSLTNEQQETVDKLDVVAVISAEMMSNEKYIGDFDGGNVTIQIPFTLPAGAQADDYSVLFIDKDGDTESVKATIENGYLSFTVPHFSEYVIVKSKDVVQPNSNHQSSGTDSTTPATGDAGMGITLTLTLMCAASLCGLVCYKKKVHY